MSDVQTLSVLAGVLLLAMVVLAALYMHKCAELAQCKAVGRCVADLGKALLKDLSETVRDLAECKAELNDLRAKQAGSAGLEDGGLAPEVPVKQEAKRV